MGMGAPYAWDHNIGSGKYGFVALKTLLWNMTRMNVVFFIMKLATPQGVTSACAFAFDAKNGFYNYK